MEKPRKYPLSEVRGHWRVSPHSSPWLAYLPSGPAVVPDRACISDLAALLREEELERNPGRSARFGVHQIPARESVRDHLFRVDPYLFLGQDRQRTEIGIVLDRVGGQAGRFKTSPVKPVAAVSVLERFPQLLELDLQKESPGQVLTLLQESPMAAPRGSAPQAMGRVNEVFSKE